MGMIGRIFQLVGPISRPLRFRRVFGSGKGAPATARNGLSRSGRRPRQSALVLRRFIFEILAGSDLSHFVIVHVVIIKDSVKVVGAALLGHHRWNPAKPRRRRDGRHGSTASRDGGGRCCGSGGSGGQGVGAVPGIDDDNVPVGGMGSRLAEVGRVWRGQGGIDVAEIRSRILVRRTTRK